MGDEIVLVEQTPDWALYFMNEFLHEMYQCKGPKDSYNLITIQRKYCGICGCMFNCKTCIGGDAYRTLAAGFAQEFEDRKEAQRIAKYNIGGTQNGMGTV